MIKYHAIVNTPNHGHTHAGSFVIDDKKLMSLNLTKISFKHAMNYKMKNHALKITHVRSQVLLNNMSNRNSNTRFPFDSWSNCFGKKLICNLFCKIPNEKCLERGFGSVATKSHETNCVKYIC